MAASPDHRVDVTAGNNGRCRPHRLCRLAQTAAPALALIGVLAIGLHARLDDYFRLREQPRYALYQGRPIQSAADGYYYLRLARDLMENAYTARDGLRAVPQGAPRPRPPPLLSLTAAGVAASTGWSLDRVGAFLPAVLGLLLALPVYAYGRLVAGRMAGLVAALLCLLAPYYVYRSQALWFDTDCMNVTWSLGCALCFLLFGIRRGASRYAWLAAGLVCAGLFYWWWDTARTEALAIAIAPLVVSVAVFRRPTRRRHLVVLALLGVILLPVLAWQAPAVEKAATKAYRALESRYLALTQTTEGPFPAQAAGTSEQVRASFRDMVNATTRNAASFLLGIGGFLWLVARHPGRTGPLISFVLLSVFSMVYANRFSLFLVPLVALGFGHLLDRLWSLRRRIGRFPGGPAARDAAAAAACVALTAAAAFPPLREIHTKVMNILKIDGVRVAGLAQAAAETPPDAVVWAWWDNGYPIQYWARRGTVSDGRRHGGAVSVFNALPLAATNETLAANFMCFFAVRGQTGVRRFSNALGRGDAAGFTLLKEALAAGPRSSATILAAGGLEPAEWTEYLFPPDPPPTYLFLDRRNLRTAHWWCWYGTWDPERREGTRPVYSPFLHVVHHGDQLRGENGLRVDLSTGAAESTKGTAVLGTVLIRDRTSARTIPYPHGQDLRFELCEPSRLGVLMDAGIAESMFNRMFLRHDPELLRFRPVLMRSPHFQLWEVLAETPPESP